MRVVQSYEIPSDGSFTIVMPKGAKPLTIMSQGSRPKLVVVQKEENESESRHFRVFTEGTRIGGPEQKKYVGSYLTSSGVALHVFEVLS